MSGGMEVEARDEPDQIAGYRIEGVAGRGGMGAVYRAVHVHLGRTVALKLLKAELAETEEFRERFLREARSAAELEHPNIVPVYDAGDADGRLFIAMKFVEGTDLARVLAAEGRLPAGRTLEIMSQLAAGLDAAHAHGLIHRDVKPANVLIDEDQRVYLTDFGLTRRADSYRPLTQTGRAVGTAAYLAPEQIRGEPVDKRVDVYALGCVLFQTLTGLPPFQRDTDMLTMWAHVGAEPPSLAAERTDLPRRVDGVITRALAKAREERYSTCGELVDAFEEALRPGSTPPGGHAQDDDTAVPRLLLVTSDPGTSLTVEAALRRSRLNVVQAADAEVALEKAVAEPPDLVVVDVALADGQALELCERLRGDPRTAAAKLVLLTSPHARVDMDAAAAIVDDYLAYPFPPMQLFDTVRQYLPQAFGESRWH